jgi:CubicO group peptidase (beta-lactamase class C family)
MRYQHVRARLFFVLSLVLIVRVVSAQSTFPGERWEAQSPEKTGVDGRLLDEIAELLGGRGCVVKDGYVIKAWGDQAERGDWMSSAKPVLSTLLFFALQEGLVSSVDQPIADFGWKLNEKDQGITFRHLSSMTSGYARPESAGEAWAYNDYAIQLYQKTLFDKVFKEDPRKVSGAARRLGALGLQDGLQWREGKRRLKASVRDFARIAWFWLNCGNWAGKQLLPESYFDDYARPQTSKALPQTEKNGKDDDYLGIGSYGGGSDHFTKYGAGIYGFNWWFNGVGRLHPDSVTWPDAPSDTYLAIGAGGNMAALFPSLNMVLISAKGNWGKLEGGKADSRMNHVLATAAKAAGFDPERVTVLGDFTKWRPVTLDFAGPRAQASDSDPNPFLDYRLQVEFTAPSGKRHDVPGFFAASNLWRCVFSPDEIGPWQYAASFRKGENVAISLEPESGAPESFDGVAGQFDIVAREIASDGFYAWGRLEYVGGHYLKFRDGDYWLKGGTDSPEDFLAYKGFSNTPRASHGYENHMRDWRAGDPDWGDGKGKAIIGALNYLASEHVNSIYFLPMNIGGDGKNVYPYLGAIQGKGSPDNDNLHFDLEKLEQWGIVFEHAQQQGIMLHFVLNEAEEGNKRELDNATLGVERKLFYRELVARFAHYPALQWNLSEEYNIRLKLAPALVKEFAQYIQDVDPYNHPITVHHAGSLDKAWTPFLGDARFPVASFQANDIGLVETWRKKSEEAGLPLVIGMDEFFPDKTSVENIERHRREYIWPIYLSGGQMEFILADLLKTDDFRKYERLWRYMAHARRFMEAQLPFNEMESCDALLSGAQEYAGENNVVAGQVFAKEGACYAIYLPAGGNATLDLAQAPGVFFQHWYNPRTGEFVGAEKKIDGGKKLPLGEAPNSPEKDWVILIQKRG